MAFTRFKYDDSRTMKELQQSTDQGRWILNVPGNGTKPHYMEDPNIRIQKWGGNLMTNHVDIENSLRGITMNNNRDYLDQSQYKKYVKQKIVISSFTGRCTFLMVNTTSALLIYISISMKFFYDFENLRFVLV